MVVASEYDGVSPSCRGYLHVHESSFLLSGTSVPLDFLEGKPISAVLPDIVEARVVQTIPPAHSQQDSAWKEATLENGLVIRVPLFIGPGEGCAGGTADRPLP